MRTLLALIAGAIVGWWAGRDYEFRQWELADGTLDEMDAVQPSDPWPPMVRGNVMPLDEDEHDLSYLEADTLRAIRMSIQNSYNPTEGM